MIFTPLKDAVITHNIFIFANPRSGSQIAKTFLNIRYQDFWVERKKQGFANDKKPEAIKGYIFNVTNPNSKQGALNRIQEACRQNTDGSE